MRYLSLGIGIAGITFLLASLGFLAISSLGGSAFGGLYRMFMYHEEHPFQYIGIISIAFGILGAHWYCWCRELKGWRRWVSIFATMLLTILVASVPGGILWKVHDMQAGYFTEGSRFWRDVSWGAREGLLLGWRVMLNSVPYNVFGLGVGALVLHALPSVVARIAHNGGQQADSERK